ncbi:MAG: porin family protein [Myxococcales bacterium]|nr:porin family protein [Myxococcales bacterium]
MKKALLLSLAALLMVPFVGAGSASAHPGPYPHYHSWRTYRPRVVPVYRPRRRRPIVVVAPAPVVVRPAPVYVVEEPPPEPAVTVVRRPEPAVVAKPRQRRDDSMFGLGVRLSGATLDGEKLGLSSAENPTMGGFGIDLRYRFNGSGLGIELSGDLLAASADDFDQTTIPVMASLTYHLFRHSRLQPYGLIGVGVHFTELSYLDGRYKYDMSELAGQAGLGLEVFITRHLSLNADVRFQTVFKDLDTQASIRTDCLHQVGDQVGFCDGIHGADPNDKMNLGVQLHAGATWYF